MPHDTIKKEKTWRFYLTRRPTEIDHLHTTKIDSQIITLLQRSVFTFAVDTKPTASPHRQSKNAVHRAVRPRSKPVDQANMVPSVSILVGFPRPPPPRSTGIGGGRARAFDRRSRCQVGGGDGGGALETLRAGGYITPHRTGRARGATYSSSPCCCCFREEKGGAPTLIQRPVRICGVGGGAKGEQNEGNTRRDRTGQCQCYAITLVYGSPRWSK